ncbi:MAG: flagellar biosynthesis protein FlhA [Sedimentisphaerales bacterium]|nr:flagellar biosynthesis protein FlhA [Sedimentisphaerales bacterium]
MAKAAKTNSAPDVTSPSELGGQTFSPLARHSNTFVAIGIVVILATLVVPLPTAVLDMLITSSLALSIAVLIVTLAAREALELSTFPSLLLFVTIFRLSLNVASTRLILLNADAGHVIETFGRFVAGGDLVVGLVIFLIIIIIQFIVITKGAERISEVAARFTLDAMPGKQMAIDADLNAGLITEAQANERRAKIVKESEFYGAMDGASKFIRGDAKASLVIVAINLIGGIAKGYMNRMSLAQAIKTYAILSVGDGLVNAIPSVIISVSSGFLVTKISSTQSIGQELSKQFLQTSRPLMTAAAIVAAMALVPGLPKVQFLILATTLAGLAQMAARVERKAQSQPPTPTPAKPESEPVEELLEVDRISVHVGVRLVSMVDPRKSKAIFERIGALRRRFIQELGIVLPLVRLRDDILLEPNAYQIRLSDVPVAKGYLEPEMYLAMDGGMTKKKTKGIPTNEPVYGLPALWISPADKMEAELDGYTVIDPESVFMTHLAECLRQHADELLTREDLQQLIERLRKTQPALVGECLGANGEVPIGLLHRVLKNLLREGIPIRDLTTILESLAEHAGKTKNPIILTELVRKALARTITTQFKGKDDKILAIVLSPALEHQLAGMVRQDGAEIRFAIPSELAIELSKQIISVWKAVMDKGLEKVVILCDSRLRYGLSELLEKALPAAGRVSVLAYDEIVSGTPVETVATVELPVENPAEELLAAQT